MNKNKRCVPSYNYFCVTELLMRNGMNMQILDSCVLIFRQGLHSPVICPFLKKRGPSQGITISNQLSLVDKCCLNHYQALLGIFSFVHGYICTFRAGFIDFMVQNKHSYVVIDIEMIQSPTSLLQIGKGGCSEVAILCMG